ncbi:MAG: hypothetical protein ABR559_10445 [Gemmatimonadota bacterium]
MTPADMLLDHPVGPYSDIDAIEAYLVHLRESMATAHPGTLRTYREAIALVESYLERPEAPAS